MTSEKKPSAAMNALDFEKLYKSIDMLRGINTKVLHPGHGKAFTMSDMV